MKMFTDEQLLELLSAAYARGYVDAKHHITEPAVKERLTDLIHADGFDGKGQAVGEKGE